MNILLIEDDAAVLKVSKLWISSAFDDIGQSVTIYEATTSEKALKLMNKDIDMVLVDMILANNKERKQEDTVSLLKELRKINNDAKYIAVTGYVEHKTIKKCIEEKLVDSVQYKPIDYDVFVESLLEIVAGGTHG